MKSIFKILSLNLLLFFMVNCETNDTNEINSLNGKWNITTTIGGLSKPNNYDSGSFTWTINASKKILTVVNKIDKITLPANLENYVDLRAEGVYKFTLEKKDGYDFLVIGNRRGTVTFRENEVFVDFGIAADDIGYILKR